MTIILGATSGRLTVIGEAGRDERGRLLVRVQCTCGNQKVIRRCSLTGSKPVKSCGCQIGANRRDPSLQRRMGQKAQEKRKAESRGTASDAKKRANAEKASRPKMAAKSGPQNWRRGRAKLYDYDVVIKHNSKPTPGGTIQDPDVLEFMRRKGVTRVESAPVMGGQRWWGPGGVTTGVL